MARAAAEGFVLVINNRPDGEDPSQPSGATIEAAARAAGLDYLHVPVRGGPTQEQVDAVHAAGGRIVLQLWHVGRISDPLFLNGELPEAPSAIQPKGHVSLVRPEKPYVTPRALELSEIPKIIAEYKRGARNAKAAGFDGVLAVSRMAPITRIGMVAAPDLPLWVEVV